MQLQTIFFAVQTFCANQYCMFCPSVYLASNILIMAFKLTTSFYGKTVYQVITYVYSWYYVCCCKQLSEQACCCNAMAILPQSPNIHAVARHYCIFLSTFFSVSGVSRRARKTPMPMSGTQVRKRSDMAVTQVGTMHVKLPGVLWNTAFCVHSYISNGVSENCDVCNLCMTEGRRGAKVRGQNRLRTCQNQGWRNAIRDFWNGSLTHKTVRQNGLTSEKFPNNKVFFDNVSCVKKVRWTTVVCIGDGIFKK